MTSKQINIKTELAERLDDMRNNIQHTSYSRCIEELFKIKEVKEEYDRAAAIRMELDRKKTKGNNKLA